MTQEPVLDTRANRRARKWSRKELLARALWETVGALVFRLTPRPLWSLRCTMLRAFGARIGRDVRIHPTVRVTIPWNLTIEDNVGIGDGAILYALGPITIRRGATISQGAHLCAGTHDFRDVEMPLEKPPIQVGCGVWVCADAFVGPNVELGAFAVLGARAVAMRDVPENAVMAGNPAQKVGTRSFNGTAKEP